LNALDSLDSLDSLGFAEQSSHAEQVAEQATHTHTQGKRQVTQATQAARRYPGLSRGRAVAVPPPFPLRLFSTEYYLYHG
jgi:hypothetical protein